MLAMLGFVATMLVVTGLIHYYLWRRVVRSTTRPGRWRRAGTIAMFCLAVLVPVTMLGTRAGYYWLAWPGYVWLAVMFYLMVIFALLELPMLAARFALRRRNRQPAAEEPVLVSAGPVRQQTMAGSGAVDRPGRPVSVDRPDGSGSEDRPGGAAPAAPGESAPDHDPDRRLLLARGAAIFAGLTATGITGYGVRTATGPPQIDRVQVPLAKLPRSMDGLRIATVSDIHIGPLAGRAHTERIVAMINRLDPDLVAVVGDLVDGTVAELGSAAAPLRDLRSRYGNFFVTGNHEYYSGAAEWVDELNRIGLRVLENERQEILARGGALDVAGVNDLAAEGQGAVGPDFDAALGGRDPSRPVVLLAHQPVQVHEAARHGVDLQLSGHTHGGQVVPFNLVVRMEQPVVSGLATVDGTQVYVTNGAGFWGPPVRVGAPPEVSLVELRAR